jgi:DNA-directed RNA polymerase subunit E'/Rpb7
MSNNLFIPIKFRSSIQLTPQELLLNYEDIIINKLKKKLENICTKHGYIKNNSIKIIKRSIGQFKKQHFNGNIIFELQCIAEICNPAKGSIIKCRIKAKNNLGLLAEAFYDNIPILEIIVPKLSAGFQSEINIDKLNIGEEINIEVCGKRHQLFVKNISIIGKVIKDDTQIIKNDVNSIEDEEKEENNEDIIIDDTTLYNVPTEDGDVEEQTDDDVKTETDKNIEDDEDDDVIDDEDEEEEDDLDDINQLDELENELLDDEYVEDGLDFELE